MIMKNKNLKFSVIIPTRERCDTLKWSLKTCTTQNYNNLEILVSDNFSQDDTRQVVADFQDSRIKYFNTGKRLSMSRNWEFALNNASGDYVLFVGDDDGLMPDVFDELNSILQDGQIDSLSWKKPMYYWLNHIIPEYRNILVTTLKNSLQEFDSQEVLNEVRNFNEFHELPSLYDGFVKRTVLENIKKQSGEFFHSRTPDVYSTIVLLGITKNFSYSGKPFSIQGASSHSNGTAYLFYGKDEQAAAKYLSEENIPFHPKLMMCPSLPVLTAECLLQAKDHLPLTKGFDFDINNLLEKSMQQAAGFSPQKYQSIAEAVNYIGVNYQIQEEATQLIAKYPNNPVQETHFFMGYNFARDLLAVKLNEREVMNIYTASLKCDEIIKNTSLMSRSNKSFEFLLNYVKAKGVSKSIDKTFNTLSR